MHKRSQQTECHISNTKNETEGSIYSTINSVLGVFDTDRLRSVGVPYRKGVCVSFKSNFKKSNFLFSRNGCWDSSTFQCHFKRLVGMASVCLNCYEMSCSIFRPRIKDLPGPLWMPSTHLFRGCCWWFHALAFLSFLIISRTSLHLNLSRGHSPKMYPWLLHPQESFLSCRVSKSSLHTKFKTLSPSYIWSFSYIQEFNLSEVRKHDHFILWMTPWHLTYESLLHASFFLLSIISGNVSDSYELWSFWGQGLFHLSSSPWYLSGLRKH